MVGAIIFCMFALGFSVYCIYLTSKGMQERQAQKDAMINEGKEYNASYSGKFYYVCGLPLAENSECILHFSDDRIVINCKGTIFSLNVEKILDMSIKTSDEVKNSISGAVGGAILLGPIGAFLGGSSTELHRFLIIIYKDKTDSEKCISFDMKDNLKHLRYVYRYIENYKNSKEKQEIEL